MKKLIVGFSKSSKKFAPGSWIIRAYQLTRYSHVYIQVPTTKFPSDHILHATEGKVLKMSKTQFDKRHITTNEFEIQIPDIQIYNHHQDEETSLYRLIIDEMHELSGDDYGIMQNIGIAYVDVMRLFGVNVKNPWQKGWNCSEFVSVVLAKVYPEQMKDIDYNTVTPKDIYKILKSLKDKNTL